MKSPKVVETNSGNGASAHATPPTFAKSYAFRSDHSLVTVLRHDAKRFHRDMSTQSFESGSEHHEMDDDLSEDDSEDSEDPTVLGFLGVEKETDYGLQP